MKIVLFFVGLVWLAVTNCSAFTFTRCEHAKQDSKTIRCLEGEINIISALYGRTTTAICPDAIHKGVTNCNNPPSLKKAKKLCDGKKLCTLTASNAMFGDPCYSINKYLDVTYECIAPVTFRRCEHAKQDSKTIQCRRGKQKINIISALYGRTTTAICPKAIHKGVTNCKNASSFKKAKQLCDGKKSCTLTASNAMFGDPCYSINKYLDVTYVCKTV